MPETSSGGNRLQITLAIIGLVGVLGGAVIANWDKIFTKQGTQATTQSSAAGAQPNDGNVPGPRASSNGLGTSTPQTGGAGQSDIESQGAKALASSYLYALKSGNVNTMMQLSETPYFCNSEIVVSTTDLRSCLQAVINQD